MLQGSRNPHLSVQLQDEQNIPSVRSSQGQWCNSENVTATSEQVTPVAVTACSCFNPISITHLCSFLFPWYFQAAVPPFSWSKRFPTPFPPALAHDVCTDLTSLPWLCSGRLLLTPLCRELLPEAPRLTGIHSCSSATSNQSLSRKDFYSSHSWEQLPVRSETNKKTTLKATFNQTTTEPHTTGCRDPGAWLLIAPAQLKWHIWKASTSLCTLINSENCFIVSNKGKPQLFLLH